MKRLQLNAGITSKSGRDFNAKAHSWEHCCPVTSKDSLRRPFWDSNSGDQRAVDWFLSSSLVCLKSSLTLLLSTTVFPRHRSWAGSPVKRNTVATVTLECNMKFWSGWQRSLLKACWETVIWTPLSRCVAKLWHFIWTTSALRSRRVWHLCHPKSCLQGPQK